MHPTVVTILASMLGLGALGALFGGGLAYAAKKFAVKVDPKVEAVQAVLGGANCGACGFPGCAAFAEAVVAGVAPYEGCIPGGADCARQIAAIMGGEVGELKEAPVAVVCCQGGRAEAGDRFIYQGYEDCEAAQLIAGGAKACIYGCLGFGTCVRACPFDAMAMNGNGLPVVFEDKCTGCGKCVKACPRGIMQLIPRSQRIYIACRSQDRGKQVKEVCTVGCTGCTLCANPKTTSSGSIRMNGFLPEIVNPTADDLEQAFAKCPTHSFVRRGEKVTEPQAQPEEMTTT
ncbi:MAG: RnfABCDGE type electron transport complex subunit B [bacterium]|jgi:electron transport complex protein RnfB|nr:RnfABCDGE type electron transport complex subunit B [candidate division KSB1 bacterium]MDH7559568.1 RnfABCDGE type electron transport complex subunit B [bacterium]